MVPKLVTLCRDLVVSVVGVYFQLCRVLCVKLGVCVRYGTMLVCGCVVLTSGGGRDRRRGE